MGKCSACGDWNSIVEEVVFSKKEKFPLESLRPETHPTV